VTDDELAWTAADDASFQFSSSPANSPKGVTLRFITALETSPIPLDSLRSMVSPESLDSWGDFSRAAMKIEGIPNLGFVDGTFGFEGAPDVIYIGVLANVTKTRWQPPQVPPVVAMVNIIWRPELGKWVVHEIGGPAHPDQLPRTYSQGVIPDAEVGNWLTDHRASSQQPKRGTLFSKALRSLIRRLTP
jgi:hypothetical protein